MHNLICSAKSWIGNGKGNQHHGSMLISNIPNGQYAWFMIWLKFNDFVERMPYLENTKMKSPKPHSNLQWVCYESMSHDINDKGDFDVDQNAYGELLSHNIRTNYMKMRCPLGQYSKLFNCSVWSNWKWYLLVSKVTFQWWLHLMLNCKQQMYLRKILPTKLQWISIFYLCGNYLTNQIHQCS